MDGTTISNLSAPSFVQREKRLVFPCEEHIADPRRANVLVEPRAPVSSTGLPEDLPHEGLGLFLAATLFNPIRIGRQIIPARTAGSLGFGRHDLHAGLYQVVPIANPFWISLPDQKHDSRGIGCGVVRQALLPVRGDLLCPPRDLIDVGCERRESRHPRRDHR